MAFAAPRIFPIPSVEPTIYVTAIVPFLNEEKTVASVVEKLIKHPLIDEIICINDGSTDRSVKRLQKFHNSITLINLKTNKGKGYAMSVGIKKANGIVVAFFDSDLINFTNAHITTLLTPILKGKARAVLGYPTGSAFSPFFKDVTGERAYFREDLLDHVNKLATTTRFSAEYHLNSLYSKKELKQVPLKKLMHLYKHEKYKPRQAVKEVVKDIVAITQQIGKTEGLMTRDIQTIINFTKKISNLQSLLEIRDTINTINNKQVQKYLKKILVYFFE